MGNIPLTPVYFNPRFHLLLIKMCASEGMTFAEIAEQLGITTRELAVWRSRYPIIQDVILKERAACQAVVENKMYAMALGDHEWTEETVRHVKTTAGKYPGETDETVTTTKRNLPSVKAQIFILKNIAPDDWKDKAEIKSEHELTIVWNETRNQLTAAEREAIKALPPPIDI